MKLKLSVYATPEQGKQLSLFDDFTFEVGEKVWWDGWLPNVHYGMQRYSIGKWVEIIMVPPMPKKEFQDCYLIHADSSWYAKPGNLSRESKLSEPSEVDERVGEVEEFKVGEIIWWNGYFPIGVEKKKTLHSKGAMKVRIETPLARSSYGVTYWVKPIEYPGSYYIFPEDLSRTKPITAGIKLAIEATPEQGEQLALFSDDGFEKSFKAGEKVWWDGNFPTGDGKIKKSVDGSRVGVIKMVPPLDGLMAYELHYRDCYIFNDGDKNWYIKKENLFKIDK